MDNISNIILFKLRKNLAELPNLFAIIASFCLDLPWVETHICQPRYQRALKQHQNNLPTLDGLEQQILLDLQQEGISITSLEALMLAHTRQFLVDAKAISDQLERRAIVQNQQQSLYYALTEDYLRHPSVYQWGLQEQLLKIIENYLRLPVAYNGCALSLSLADSKDEGCSTRIWHKDRHDRQVLKIAVYLNNVDEHTGPLQYMPPEISRTLPCSGMGVYRYLQQNKITPISVTGAAGTVVFIDTARLIHRGQPPTKTHRHVIYFAYFTRRPKYPFWCRSSFSKPAVARLTASLSRQSKQCAEWRQELPILTKWLSQNIV
jgi:hypothetical protein